MRAQAVRFFAIRRKSDRAWLPAVVGRRGCTARAEPSTTKPPRLFSREHHAKRALKEWARGAQREVWTGGGSMSWGGGYFDPDPSSELKIEPVEGRDASDFEVVEVRVRVATKVRS